MKTIIQGKNVKVTNYVDTKMKSVEIDGEETAMYVGEPEIKQGEEIEWANLPEIPEINGEIQFNNRGRQSSTSIISPVYDYINIGEDKEVRVIESICRVDIPATVIHVNKELSRAVINLKQDCQEELEKHLLDYKQQVVNSDEKVAAYVRLHNLDLKNINLNDLLKTVYPNGGAYVDRGKVCVNRYDKKYPRDLDKIDSPFLRQHLYQLETICQSNGKDLLRR